MIGSGSIARRQRADLRCDRASTLHDRARLESTSDLRASRPALVLWQHGQSLVRHVDAADRLRVRPLRRERRAFAHGWARDRPLDRARTPMGQQRRHEHVER